MADSVTVDNGTLTDFAVSTDEGATGHVQRVKLAYSANGSEVHVDADANGLLVNTGANNAVRPQPHVTKITAASSGLTTATTAYAAGDTVGALRTVTGAARTSGNSGIIRGIFVHDKANITSQLTVFIFRATLTLAADNAAFAISDTDMDLLCWRGTISMTNEGNQRVGIATPYTPFDCSASDLFIAVRTETIPGGAGFFGAATDLPIKLWIVQD